MINRYRMLALVALLAGGLAAAGTARAQGGLGITAGLNFNALSDIEVNNRDATFDNASGWHLGLWFDLPLGPVSVRPGIRYMDAGSVFETDDEDVFGVPGFGDFNVSLIEVPIDVRFRFGMPLVAPYVMAGPVLRFPSGGDDDDDRLESFSYAGSLGVGVELGLGGIRLFPELKYTFGISRFTKKDFEIGGTTIRPDDNGNLNTIMLSLGVGL